MKEHLAQLRRYCVVGAASLGLALGILAALHELIGVDYLIAYCVSFIASNVAGYLLNARFTFSIRSDHSGAARYMAVNAALLGVNTAAMRLLVSVFGVWYIGAAILLAIVNAPISFIVQRLITYRLTRRSRTAQT